MSLSKIQSVSKHPFRICDSIQLDNGITIPCITGQVGQVDVVSQNGYRYKKGFWDKVLSDPLIQEQIEGRDIFGMIEHPVEDDAFLKTPYDLASHVIIKAFVQDGNPWAVLGLLNNEKGNQIKALVDVGHRPGVSTRGLGAFERDDISQYVSDENYMFITWDIVRSPNFSNLKMDKVTDSLMKSPLFVELCEMHKLKDSASEDYPKSKLADEMHKAVDEILKRYNL